MKIRYYLGVIVLVLLTVQNSRAKIADWAKLDRYEEANKELMAAPPDSNRVVFYGNSITQFWASKHPEFFERTGYVGRGISGQSTYQFLTRFRKDVVDLKPALVVINAATNDVAENTHPYNEDLTMGNIMSMVEIAKANGIKVILTTTLPAAAFRWNPEITDAPEKIDALNKRVAAYAAEQNIPYVDYFSALADDEGRGLRPEFSNDGVHPTVAAYEVMEAIIEPVIKTELVRK